jgi:hypothetical protein
MAPLVGAWVQDTTGTVLTTRKRYAFNPDGSYAFVVTSRTTGSLEQNVLVTEDGTFSVDAGRLTLAPPTGPAKTFPWRIEPDPYVGGIRLVLVLPDGMLDIYYQE